MAEGEEEEDELDEEVARPEARTGALGPSLIADSAQRWRGTLEVSLRSAIVPYGYTITIWASGAYLINLRGAPDLLSAFGFVAGALLAFAMLASISSRLSPSPSMPTTDDRPDPSHPIFAAGLHVVAVGLALGSASVADSLVGGGSWIISSFLATSVYLGAASLELAIALEVADRELRVRNLLRRGRRAP